MKFLFLISTACACLLFCFNGISEGAIKLTYLKDRPNLPIDKNALLLGVKSEGDLILPLRAVKGESEGVLILLYAGSAKSISIQYAETSPDLIGLRVYRVENVVHEGGFSIPDPLVPVSPDTVIKVRALQLFYIRLTIPMNARTALLEHNIKFNADSGERSGLKIRIDVLPLSLSLDTPITIQANIRPYEKWPKELEERVRLLKYVLSLLSEYRINAAAGMKVVKDGVSWGEREDDDIMRAYMELVEFCFESLHFRRIRLPGKRMYNWKKPMSHDYPDGPPGEKTLQNIFNKYLKRFDPLLKNKKWVGKLGYKIWDEPRERDYPYVVQLYRAARKVAPELKYELSEQPDVRLQNIADTWTPNIRYLKPESIAERHRLGQEVWIYANKVHGINHPLYGMRIIGWLLWKYDLDGYHFWGVNWWKEDPWVTVSSQKRDSFKSGTLIYPDPRSNKVYPSLRLETFRDGIEDMLLLKELEKTAVGNTLFAKKAQELVTKLKEYYNISERYENSPNPVKFRNRILDILVKKVPLNNKS